jgi:hypothetical protein
MLLGISYNKGRLDVVKPGDTESKTKLRAYRVHFHRKREEH